MAGDLVNDKNQTKIIKFNTYIYSSILMIVYIIMTIHRYDVSIENDSDFYSYSVFLIL